jgi:LPXTG-site transpeptidase (sortase) family protein
MKRFKFLIIILFAVFGAGVGIYFASYQNSNIGPPPKKAVKISFSPAKTIERVGIPIYLEIPKLNVRAKIESVAKDSLGRMDVPQNFYDTAWYNLGPKPGEHGSAVIDGHVDTPTGAPSVFYNLDKLSPGDSINITDDAGKSYSFRISSVENYDIENIPLEKIFSVSTPSMLNLITCSGTYDLKQHEYLSRTVVYSKLVK